MGFKQHANISIEHISFYPLLKHWIRERLNIPISFFTIPWIQWSQEQMNHCGYFSFYIFVFIYFSFFFFYFRDTL